MMFGLSAEVCALIERMRAVAGKASDWGRPDLAVAKTWSSVSLAPVNSF
jgi:hypothetical protein